MRKRQTLNSNALYGCTIENGMQQHGQDRRKWTRSLAGWQQGSIPDQVHDVSADTRVILQSLAFMPVSNQASAPTAAEFTQKTMNGIVNLPSLIYLFGIEGGFSL